MINYWIHLTNTFLLACCNLEPFSIGLLRNMFQRNTKPLQSGASTLSTWTQSTSNQGCHNLPLIGSDWQQIGQISDLLRSFFQQQKNITICWKLILKVRDLKPNCLKMLQGWESLNSVSVHNGSAICLFFSVNLV